jgi:two-component system chemotaxis response regulator CheY
MLFPEISSLQVLVIDDSAMTRNVIAQILGNFGVCHVIEAENGVRGTEFVESLRPDLILCDLNMEPIDGFEFIAMLRKNKDAKIRETPVIVLTSHDEEDMVKKAAGLKIEGYLLKPIAPKALAKSIVKAIKRVRGEGSQDPGSALSDKG